ncbi:MAG: Asp-tRNA(Asn)/Glu-tRNA(Gln) amidotransferase subunit GatC [Bdellovibrio sp.]|nr:Asp-tRNA(Asn)/Glu-tRNA(Gln) amidotransferase subunit GatC [Bdellovibrio sp.]
MPTAKTKIQITPELTRKVAHLARLSLTDEEIHRFSKQLDTVLAYVERLQELDVTGVEPLGRPFDLATPMREDEAKTPESENLESLLSTASETVQNGFKVPPVL